VKKYWTVGQATENNMAHALFMLDTSGEVNISHENITMVVWIYDGI